LTEAEIAGPLPQGRSHRMLVSHAEARQRFARLGS
jgi:hypothetical protein